MKKLVVMTIAVGLAAVACGGAPSAEMPEAPEMVTSVPPVVGPSSGTIDTTAARSRYVNRCPPTDVSAPPLSDTVTSTGPLASE